MDHPMAVRADDGEVAKARCSDSFCERAEVVALREAVADLTVGRFEIKAADLALQAPGFRKDSGLLPRAAPSLSSAMSSEKNPALADPFVLFLGNAEIAGIAPWPFSLDRGSQTGEFLRSIGPSSEDRSLARARPGLHAHAWVVGIDGLQVLELEGDGVDVPEAGRVRTTLVNRQ